MYLVIDDPNEGGNELTVAAHQDGATMGIATAVFDAPKKKAHLQAVVVQPEYRGRGIACGLLASLETEAKARGMTVAHTMFESGQPNVEIVEHILKKLAWQEPLPGMVLCKARNPEQFLAAAEWTREPLPPDAELFAWTDLSEEEKARLSSEQQGSAWFPMALGPMPDKPVEPMVSVGVRRNGEIVGWMLTHRTGPDSVQYSRLFIRKDERRSNLATVLLAEAIRGQGRAGIDIGEFGVRSDNHPMLGFLEQRLAPLLFERKEVRYLEKSL